MAEDTSEPAFHRIEIRVVAPPGVSNLLPLREIERMLEWRGLTVVGLRAVREDEQTPSDPSTLP